MAYVRLAVTDDTQQITVRKLGQPKAQVVEILIQCYQPDGTWKAFRWSAGEVPEAVPGAGHLRFTGDIYGGIWVANQGDAEGYLWCRLIDDAGNVIFQETTPRTIPVGEAYIFPTGGITFDMPDRDYVLTIEAGH